MVAATKKANRGLKWRLSYRHKDHDTCDSNAKRDVGFGDGVYLPGHEPRIPSHYGCRCYYEPVNLPGVTPVTAGEGANQRTYPDPNRPQAFAAEPLRPLAPLPTPGPPLAPLLAPSEPLAPLGAEPHAPVTEPFFARSAPSAEEKAAAVKFLEDRGISEVGSDRVPRSMIDPLHVTFVNALKNVEDRTQTTLPIGSINYVKNRKGSDGEFMIARYDVPVPPVGQQGVVNINVGNMLLGKDTDPKELENQRAFMVGQNLDDVITHELGHAANAQEVQKLLGVSDEELANLQHASPDERAEYAKNYERATLNLMSLNFTDDDPTMLNTAREVSRYATANSAEFVAETFVKKMKHQPISPDVQKMYDLFSGPKVTP
jgi:hypothetical protein